MLPIIPGCKALIYKGYKAGKEVRVGNFLGDVFIMIDKDMWEIDIQIKYYHSILDIVKYESMIPEDYLMRIDGEEEKLMLETGDVQPITIGDTELEES